MFSPDGTLGDIPYEQMKAALAAGAKPGVSIKAPDGSLGVVPADRYQDAAKAGATIVPIKDQETQHPGFWANAADDLQGLLHPSGFSPYPGMDQEAKSAAATQHAQEDASRKAAGYSLPYRVGAPIAQAAGANVPGMEQSAAEGDVGGVLGHAAAPVATIAAGEALAHGASAVSDAAKTAAQSRIGRTAGKTAFDVASDIPVVRQLAKVKQNWEATAPQATPDLDATSENKPFAGGPDEYRPSTKELDATGENKSFAGGTDEPSPVRVPKKAAAPAKVEPPAASATPAAASPTAASAPSPEAAAPAAEARRVVVDPQTGRPEFSDVLAAKQAPTAAAATTDPILARLQQNAAKIQSEESAAAAAPKADEDLTDLLQKSVDQAKAGRAAKDAGKTITVPGQGEVPRFVYRARDVGEEGVPAASHAQAGSDFNRILKYAEPGQRSENWGEVVRIDLAKLQPKDFSALPGPDGGHWVQFKRPLTEDEVTPFAGQHASAK
jgi:hypothetical protein